VLKGKGHILHFFSQFLGLGEEQETSKAITGHPLTIQDLFSNRKWQENAPDAKTSDPNFLKGRSVGKHF